MYVYIYTYIYIHPFYVLPTMPLGPLVLLASKEFILPGLYRKGIWRLLSCFRLRNLEFRLELKLEYINYEVTPRRLETLPDCPPKNSNGDST